MHFGQFFMSLETSSDRFSFLSGCLAEFFAYVHPTVFREGLSFFEFHCGETRLRPSLPLYNFFFFLINDVV